MGIFSFSNKNYSGCNISFVNITYLEFYFDYLCDIDDA